MNKNMLMLNPVYYSKENTHKNKSNKFNFDIFLCSLLALSLPITNFSFSIAGIRLEPQRFLLTICIIRFILHISFADIRGIKRQKLVWKILWPIFFAVIYALFLSFLQPDFIDSIRIAPETEIYGFILKRGGKYLSYVILLIYLALVINSDNKVHTVLCTLAASLCITEMLGIIQSFVFLVTGIDILPINRSSITVGNIVTQSVSVKFLGLNFLRINSLTNEPKALGIVTTFLFFMKLYWNEYRQNHSFKTSKFLDSYMSKTLWLSVIVILLTFSGSGLISLAFGLALFIFTSGKKLFSAKGNALIFIIFSSTILLTLSIFSAALFDKVDSFLQVSILRRLGGFATDSSIESLYMSVDPEDGAALYSIFNYPNAVFSGFGFGAYSNISMVYYSLYYPNGFSPFSRSILIETIFSVGIPGLILLSLFLYRINIRFISGKHYFINQPLQLMLNHIILINFSLRTLEPLFFYILGILISLYLNRVYLINVIQMPNSQHNMNQ